MVVQQRQNNNAEQFNTVVASATAPASCAARYATVTVTGTGGTGANIRYSTRIEVQEHILTQ